MSFFRVTISGIEGLTQELNQEVLNISTAAGNALQIVGAEMTESLKQHIQKDVYDAYSQKSYPRRKDNPQFGNSLLDSVEDATVTRNQLILEYSPDGYHKGKIKDTLNFDPSKAKGKAKGKVAKNPIKPNPLHGDNLIERIQTGKGYDWWRKDKKIPPRSFWNNFVDEMRNGAVKRIFAENMKPYSLIYDTTDLIFDDDESYLEAQGQFDFDDENNEEAELPF